MVSIVLSKVTMNCFFVSPNLATRTDVSQTRWRSFQLGQRRQALMNLEEVKTYKMGKKHRGDPGDGRRWPRPNTRQHLAVIILAPGLEMAAVTTLAAPNRSNYQHLIVPTFYPARVRLSLAAVGLRRQYPPSNASITHSMVSLLLVTSFVSAVCSHKLRRAGGWSWNNGSEARQVFGWWHIC